jgi:hypothetical protein
MDLKMYHSLTERPMINTGCLEMLKIFSEMSKKGNGRTVEFQKIESIFYFFQKIETGFLEDHNYFSIFFKRSIFCNFDHKIKKALGTLAN